MNNRLEPTIGLEIHAELRTNSKMFCGCTADHFGKIPNTQTCPVCLGLPGALPVPNKKAVEWTIMLGLALNCKVNRVSKFDRKHYFYPDLPKGYQISQYDEPLAINGWLEIQNPNSKIPEKIRITRVHLEEDTGKLQHTTLDGKRVTLVDFNRSGVALVEIVTEPDIHSGSQTKEFAQKLQNIIRYLGISDCDMEKGSMRLEANTSWGLDLGYKVEIKNLNSFRFVEKAVDYDLVRQKAMLDKGETPRQETRGWSEKEGKTVTQRYKETAADYRYFPEPDIPPMIFDKAFIERIGKSIPELPETMLNRFVKQYAIRKDYAEILTTEKNLANFTEKVFKLAYSNKIPLDKVAGYIVNSKIDYKKVEPKEIITLIQKKKAGKVENEEAIVKWIDAVLKLNPQAVADYKKGKLNAISVLIGNVMKISKGSANPMKVRQLIEKKLSD
ncbi:hypothetical protein A2715_05755 [Candidatus Woesebacteria bacterium RIFCSPHIGHO2_01_FULL_39_32]|uniref:Aspartyl/glutamyl-tRNA(Asn/Gln) amidotransferase subunit B n=1 Tax=Candidatus Woesebacteria bacterium RIFCSPLOWO2_01_FULL_39_25 TaxID=1802521 RepID=A0A1F8BM09_9BACT|nr:MAG: hypothetical protein A2715_05755 [Candidatus Woesebacteria bacterium RIFCSPHIGHO2_01_FULL_39_32]OGM36801.1 MAG: hypothetical protein A3F01_00225 [Candidatus Woesebacteria bacterium RIFCSPHIGHO2_12_FULL_38_11]OGM65052.1 MAG: hypothetical protein A2893_05365 [Candidatus Woesebacteria bacterium RIFCSPLOWO2_01_FULL_39_25]